MVRDSGSRHHTFGSGGYEAAEWFRSQGFAAFILKYRVEETPRAEADYQAYVAEKMAGYRAGGLSGNYAPATPDYAYEDMNAAVKLVRTRAKDFHVKPDRIGICVRCPTSCPQMFAAMSSDYLWPEEFLAWLRMLKFIDEPASSAVLHLNNGIDMPQFGLGTFRSSVQEAHDAVLWALRAGYRHIDTAHAYQNERGVGAAVKESGIPREEIWITSKLWPTDYASGNVEESINKMLERLGTDYIDLLYLHQPVGDYMAGWRGLEAAVKAGKVRAIGLSNFDLNEELFDEVIAKAEIRPAKCAVR
ncbi:MAG: aldo/keto reductase [Synergistaceae bacterium]|nr:aldo/keto reductase [Synergistaceae bacterium]